MSQAGQHDLSTPRPCGCENTECQHCGGDGCQGPREVPCMYVGALCGSCAEYMPADYLLGARPAPGGELTILGTGSGGRMTTPRPCENVDPLPLIRGTVALMLGELEALENRALALRDRVIQSTPDDLGKVTGAELNACDGGGHPDWLELDARAVADMSAQLVPSRVWQAAEELRAVQLALRAGAETGPIDPGYAGDADVGAAPGEYAGARRTAPARREDLTHGQLAHAEREGRDVRA